jgi:hypothetical protein
MLHIIKGCPRDKWEEVQAIQHDPFVYIMGNGSKWAGQEEDDIETLLDVLAKYRLDVERFGPEFYDINPCTGIRNPKAPNFGPDDPANPHWIDGPRLYACDGVYRFGGNFLNLSHGFSVDTNHKPTINALIAAIEANKNLPESTK